LGNRANLDKDLVADYPADRKPRTRARLLERAIEVSARFGYHGMSADRVIAGTGISRSAFYEHFPDRAECFLAALDLLAERLLAELRAAAQGSEQGIGPVVEAMVGFARNDPAGAKLLFVESLAAGPRSLQLREALLARVEDLLEEALALEPDGAESLDLPMWVLSRGVFRLLAIRLSRPDPELADLSGDLIAWANSYRINTCRPAWRQAGRPGSIGTLPVELPPPSGADSNPERLPVGEPSPTQRLRILDAVARCAHERGYEALTVTEIVAEAKVSRAAFYAQFRDSSEAAREANERVFQGGISACATGFFSELAWPERAWAGGVALLSFLAAHPAGSCLAFVESPAVGEAAIEHAYERLRTFTLFLEEGYRFRPEAERLPRITSEALMATMFEWAFHELRQSRGAERLLAILPQLTYVILAPFMGPEAAAEFVEKKISAASQS
jgi:AcrR family transcriptional regulator